MDNSETVPLIGIQEFLEEVAEIQQLNKSYNENLDKINTIQGNLLQISWKQEAREKQASELENLMSRNKEFQKIISKVCLIICTSR